MKRNNTAQQTEHQNTQVTSLEVSGVREVSFGSGSTIYFNLQINGVTIYGCRVVEGQRGDFIGWPSQKGKDGKYWNYAYCPLSDEDTAAILAEVERQLNDGK